MTFTHNTQNIIEFYKSTSWYLFKEYAKQQCENSCLFYGSYNIIYNS